MCFCRPKRFSGSDSSLTLSGMLFGVSSFTFDICKILLFPDAFSKRAVIPTCSPSSEFAVTLVAFCLDDVFIDVIANSILGARILSKAFKFEFWILSSTVSTV